MRLVLISRLVYQLVYRLAYLLAYRLAFELAFQSVYLFSLLEYLICYQLHCLYQLFKLDVNLFTTFSSDINRSKS